jgi:hypothetical protein
MRIKRGDTMKIEDKVYCVACNSMVSRAEADVIFRTGFYKVTIPLAHCKDCAEKAKALPQGIHEPIAYVKEYEAAEQPLLT